ncbi:MAG: carnitine dehydratase [Gammaproteobacteria bacterium CG22_combo_CG10-13_8_21_14_all_40_8]|nr:MAG: carnitine dehydratase [Gammaproteobacteria bacterium CG22_combo_CG10-13_8_21_14_all_40_8]
MSPHTHAGPLKNIKILDFTNLLPGPYATMLMADMGAEVVRVESPNRPDLVKLLPPFFKKQSYAHLSLNRNKKSLALDLFNDQGQAVIHKLVQEYDIVIEQFRPGIMQKIGLDYVSLKKINPKIIYCSITGYGQTGPYKNKAGHDINYLAVSGLASYSGKKSTGPVLSGTQIADLAAGSQHAVMAILAAIIERNETSIGQYLDISMADGVFSLNALSGAVALATAESPELESELLNGGSCYDYYQTADHQYLSVGILEEKFALRFFDVLGHPDWLCSFQGSVEERSALKTAIQDLIAEHDLAYWTELFEAVDCCVEPVLTILEASQHPLFVSRNMCMDIALDNKTQVKQIAPAIKFSEQVLRKQCGRLLGEDSLDIMMALNYPQHHIQQLIENKVIFCATQNKQLHDREDDK